MRAIGEQTVGNFVVKTEEWDGFILESIRPVGMDDGDFRPAMVKQGDRVLWSFKKDTDGKCVASLYIVDDEYVIVLTAGSTLHSALPIRDLPHLTRVGTEYIGGRRLEALVEMKHHVAQASNLRVAWTRRESPVVRHLRPHPQQQPIVASDSPSPLVIMTEENLRREQEEAREGTKRLEAMRAAAAQAEADKAKRQVERAKRRQAIALRSKIFAHTISGGARRVGVPVVGDEWKMLGNDTLCISVTSYDEETGVVGDVLEAFKVVKDGGTTPRRDGVSSVALRTQTAPGSAAPESELELRFKRIELRPGEMEEVVCVPSMDAVRALRDKGVNGGTLVMCPKKGDPERDAVFSLQGGKILPVTEVKRVSA